MRGYCDEALGETDVDVHALSPFFFFQWKSARNKERGERRDKAIRIL